MPTLAVPDGVRSPGWRSDLGLHAALGSLREVEEGWCCRLPTFPENPFGHMVVLRGSPAAWTPAAVADVFERHLGRFGVEQLCVGWDDPEADASSLAPFVARGFEPIDDVAMAFDGPVLDVGGARGGVRLRRLDLDRDLPALRSCELAVDEGRRSPYGAVAVGHGLDWARSLLAEGNGVGAWYGAELDGQLVATLGVVSVGGVGRLQSVGTRPEHRCRGIGRALVAHASRDAVPRFEVEQLMLVTSRGGGAERFYRGLGFRRIGVSLGVLRAR